MKKLILKLFKVDPVVKYVYSIDPIRLVNRITDEGFRWYDYSALPQDELLKYYQAAREAIDNPALLNEVTRLNAEFAQFAAKEATNFEAVLAMRHQMSGIMLVLERLRSIPDPTKKTESNESPFEAI